MGEVCMSGFVGEVVWVRSVWSGVVDPDAPRLHGDSKTNELSLGLSGSETRTHTYRYAASRTTPPATNNAAIQRR
jgi:hypothetical protein